MIYLNKNQHDYDFDGFAPVGGGAVTNRVTRRAAVDLLGGWFFGAILMLSLLSGLLLLEARGLPPGDIEDRIVEYATRWDDLATSLHFDQPHIYIQDTIMDWQNASWRDLACAVSDTRPADQSGDDTETTSLSWIAGYCRNP